MNRFQWISLSGLVLCLLAAGCHHTAGGCHGGCQNGHCPAPGGGVVAPYNGDPYAPPQGSSPRPLFQGSGSR